MRDHKKLRAFELADQLALAVLNETRLSPKQDLFGLTPQIRRAAISVASNIVEGCARDTETDYLRFLHIAYASARELEYQLSLALRLGLLTTTGGPKLDALSQETAKVLNGLIRALSPPNKKIAAEGRTKHPPVSGLRSPV